MDLHRHLRSLALLIFILATYFSTSLARHHPVRHRHNRHKRQHGHSATYLPGSYVITGGNGTGHGPWGQWSEPTECSRSCGGGVASQTRTCRDRNERMCSGGNTRYFSCNIQDCPEVSRDFRAEQCAEFNKVPFEGRNYEWVPYTRAPSKCELNCMPRGDRFYYRHKTKVVDGTRCDEEKLDICVNGTCLPVGCDMMLGSTAKEDKCRECRGDGSSCRTITGVLEMDDLQVGYNDILLIPAGATNIRVQEVRASNNYLAIRNSTNYYYLNGNWRIDFPRSLRFAGTLFHYERKPHPFLAPETITALGPTTEAIYIVVLIQEQNPGISYEYSIHKGDVHLPEPYNYTWIHDDFAECSVTCGGGIRTRNVTCVRKDLVVQLNNLCNPILEPKSSEECNADPCPPRWSIDDWGSCSETCGEGGTQIRQVYCEQVVSNNRPSVVEDEQCTDVLGPKPSTTQQCEDLVPCPTWHLGPWKACDRLCGDGYQRRKVVCFRRVNDLIEVLGDSACPGEKPKEEKPCMLRPCEGVDWVTSDWTGCDNKCGLTHETRTVHCANKVGKVYPDSRCHQYRQPKLIQECENYVECDHEWFASQWSDCSAECGSGIKTRKVFCGSFDGETVKRADNNLCDIRKKYESIANCTGKEECPGQWFAGPWSPCSKNCGGGDKSRKVLCFVGDQPAEPSKCDSNVFPFLSETCNVHPCTGDQIMPMAPTDPLAEDEEEICEDVTDFITLATTLKVGGVETSTDSSEGGSGDMESPATGSTTDRVSQVVTSSPSDSMMPSSSVGIADLKPYLLETSSKPSAPTDPDPYDIMLSDSTYVTDLDSTLHTAPSGTEDSLLDTTDYPFTESSIHSDEYEDEESTIIPSGTSSAEFTSSTEYGEDDDEYDEDTEDTISEIESTTDRDVSSTASGADLTESEEQSTTEIDDKTDTETHSEASSVTESSVSDEKTTETSEESSVSDEETTETSEESKSSIETSTVTSSSSDSATIVTLSSEATESVPSTTTSTEASKDSTTEENKESTITSITETTMSDSTESTKSTETTFSVSSTTQEDSSSTTSFESSTATEISATDASTTSSLESTSSATTAKLDETTIVVTTLKPEETTKYESPGEIDDPDIFDKPTPAPDTTTHHIPTTIKSADTTTEVSEETTMSSSSLLSTEETALSTEETTLSTEETTLSTEETALSTEETTLSTEETSRSSERTTLTSEETTELTTETSVSTTLSSEGTTLSSEGTTELMSSDSTTVETTVVTTESSLSSDMTRESTTQTEETTIVTEESSESTTVSSEITVPSSEGPTKSSVSTTMGSSSETARSDESSEEDTVTFSTTPASTTAGLEILATTPSPVQIAITKEQKVPRKCRRRKKIKPTCDATKFGCCLDGITEAQGPFNEGCPTPETCAETKYGCCSDGVSPALGPEEAGCPQSQCAETLFGCCPDQVSVAQGNDYEGCRSEEVPFDCKTTQFGCCPDNETAATGPNLQGCFECVGSGDCESCNDTRYGCCPDGIQAASGANFTGCDEDFTGSGFFSSSSTTEEPIYCSDSEYGCCPDGFTPADGPNFEGCGVINRENCSASYFQCCPDGETPALGPNREGCPRMPCEDSIYGCCDDMITPAHGPNHEGCCLNTEFGCCPDNILIAQGFNNEGCGCQYSRYGCCPDNKTAARGRNAEGCGCKYTPHGCCPNNYTPAAGPGFKGCPCYTTQFGCCPDGLTMATGPRAQGCGCENTEFGCCSDGRTPASGPDKGGCGCESSQYGCCPDGVTDARGNKFEGCKNAPIIPAEACTQKRERGPCRDFTVKWFFDMEYGGCSRFWYGGCGGNHNRFKSQDDCKNTCVEPPGRDACYLPKIEGPCEGYYPTWYYDSERRQCGQFIYGGCLGNNNKFQTKEECNELCILPDTVDSCEQPKMEGPCKGNYSRWYYDQTTHMCQRFTYGGCKGNANNFYTETACHQQCLKPGKSRDSCALPRAQGNCTERLPQWYFDASENRCMPFYYSGCEGNANRFETQEACEKDCPPKIEQDICMLPAVVGECHNYTERWYYNAYEVRCTLFYYGGCGGNQNNFPTMEDCHRRCEAVTTTPAPAEEFRRESCFIPYEQGPCSAALAQWFYDSRDGVCKQFLYGGCQGNQNRFATQRECEWKCENVQDICSLPQVVGPCDGNSKQWFYNHEKDTCEEFDYSGCQGNGNRFNHEWQCEERCKKLKSTTEDLEPGALEATTPDPSINEVRPRDICSIGADRGPCRAEITAWYYNEANGKCEQFIYGGCGGNANKFVSEEQCERQCGAFRGQDVCNIPYDTGLCRAAFPKWYYDSSTRRCLEFIYGGCEGNGNRFSSIEECESICLRREEIIHQGNDTVYSRQAICRLPVDSGPCPESHYKRWYFDEERRTCIPFIYTGCAGNLNRFKNFHTCLAFCSVLLYETRRPDTGSVYVEPEDRCSREKEDCNQLHCPYGVERSVNEQNCEVCGCHDPCRGSSCPEQTNCAVDLHRNPSTGMTEFRAICRHVNKPGLCPRQVNVTGTDKCVEECSSDADCVGDFKCCFYGCSSSCVSPAVTDHQPATEGPPSEIVGTGDEAPRILATESDVTEQEGGYATLNCIVRGNPTPTISWKKGNVHIDGTGGRHRLLPDGSLQVIGLYRQDSGMYRCTASNGIGYPAYKDFQLRVTEPTSRPTEIIGEPDASVVVTLGVPTLLYCYAVGWPTPIATWWRGDRMLPLSSDVYEQRSDFSLLIHSVTLRNLGPYTCQAYNGVGRAASWTVTIKAIGPVFTGSNQETNYTKYLVAPPRRPADPTYPYRPNVPPQRPRPPQVQTEPPTQPPLPVPETEIPREHIAPVQANVSLERTLYPIGSDISIPCDVAGYPTPRVQWFKDGQPIETNGRIQVTESHRILIMRADKADAGSYRCEAINQYGSASSSVSISVEGVYIHPNCTDNPFFANCKLIVAAKYCTHQYYARFCCKSCTQAGQLPSHGPHLNTSGSRRK